jgi:hypothetical protein
VRVQDSFCSGYIPEVSYCNHDNKSSYSIKGVGFLEKSEKIIRKEGM